MFTGLGKKKVLSKRSHFLHLLDPTVYLCLEHRRPEIISSLGLSNVQELIENLTITDLLQDSLMKFLISQEGFYQEATW